MSSCPNEAYPWKIQKWHNPPNFETFAICTIDTLLQFLSSFHCFPKPIIRKKQYGPELALQYEMPALQLTHLLHSQNEHTQIDFMQFYVISPNVKKSKTGFLCADILLAKNTMEKCTWPNYTHSGIVVLPCVQLITISNITISTRTTWEVVNIPRSKSTAPSCQMIICVLPRSPDNSKAYQFPPIVTNLILLSEVVSSKNVFLGTKFDY